MMSPLLDSVDEASEPAATKIGSERVEGAEFATE